MKYLACFAAFALLLSALPAAAQTGAWTAVASAGAVDDASLSRFEATANGFQHATGATGMIHTRFSVTNTSGTDTPAWDTLSLGFSDSHSQGYVTAILFQVDPVTGVATFMCAKSSTDIGAGSVSCTFPQQIDFSLYNYVVEVQVNRSSVNANPIARTLRIH